MICIVGQKLDRSSNFHSLSMKRSRQYSIFDFDGFTRKRKEMTSISEDASLKLDIDGNTSENIISSTPPNEITMRQVSNQFEGIELNRSPNCHVPLSNLRPNSITTVFYKLPYNKSMIPLPYPDQFTDLWESKDHIKMPFSPNNQVFSYDSENKIKKRVSKWSIIERELRNSRITSCNQFINIVKTYNPTMEKMEFNVLTELIDNRFNKRQRDNFFENLLPKMISLALQLPTLVRRCIPILKQRNNRILFFSQQQISSLLANAFFCTFPKRSLPQYSLLPEINFKGLFSNDELTNINRKIEKLKCLLNYFSRVTNDIPSGVVSFERRCLSREEIPDWINSDKPLTRMIVLSGGLIESEGQGMLQVVFANKYIGGGALESGCVQEEIRFMTNPELILARLFTEKLSDNEVIFITGSEQFNDYKGYSDSFHFNGDFEDALPSDEWGRKFSKIVAMDATFFHLSKKKHQYYQEHVDRELIKAFCGFMERDNLDPKNKSAIASGNWGCGVYNGDPRFKACLQLMAASQCDRELVYFTFKDDKLKQDLDKFYDYLILNEYTVGLLYEQILAFGNHVKTTDSEQGTDFLKHMFEKLIH